jgi:predicted dehydrogenase
VTLRLGILGAAAIAPEGIVEPARDIAGVELVAVAARDRERAQAFSATHGVPRAEPSYDALLASPDVDAVYVPLVASAHREWCERALLAGKHVLCEKPLAMSGTDARHLVALARNRELELAEAFHYRYHPLMSRLLEIVASGELGAIEFVEGVFVNNVPRTLPVFWDPALGGGATRHNGCYPLHCMRTVVGEEPQVLVAEAEWAGDLDLALTAELRFPGGVRGRVRCSFVAPEAEVWLRVEASHGELLARNFIFPYLQPGRSTICRGGAIDVRADGGSRREHFAGPTTYHCQLAAFVDSLCSGTPMATSGADIIGNAQAIESMLTAASR